MENMILQPIVVGGQTFKNRIMFPPLTTGYEKNGMISEQDMGFYTRLAKGGVGYIVLGDVAPSTAFLPPPSCLTTARSRPSRSWPTVFTPTAPSWVSSSSTRSTMWMLSTACSCRKSLTRCVSACITI